MVIQGGRVLCDRTITARPGPVDSLSVDPWAEAAGPDERFGESFTAMAGSSSSSAAVRRVSSGSSTGAPSVLGYCVQQQVEGLQPGVATCHMFLAGGDAAGGRPPLALLGSTPFAVLPGAAAGEMCRLYRSMVTQQQQEQQEQQEQQQQAGARMQQPTPSHPCKLLLQAMQAEQAVAACNWAPLLQDLDLALGSEPANAASPADGAAAAATAGSCTSSGSGSQLTSLHFASFGCEDAADEAVTAASARVPYASWLQGLDHLCDFLQVCGVRGGGVGGGGCVGVCAWVVACNVPIHSSSICGVVEPGCRLCFFAVRRTCAFV